MPGPSAITAAVSISGFNDRFPVHGFLPKTENDLIKTINSLKNLDLDSLGIPSKDYLVKKYCEMLNRKVINPNFYIAFSMFRNVAILEGVLARGRAGNAASSSAEEKGALSKPLAKIAWDLVQNSNLD